MLRGHRDLKVFQLAYKLAMEIFRESRAFPNEERYSLTDQIRRSSRSVASNIAKGFEKDDIQICSSASWRIPMGRGLKHRFGSILRSIVAILGRNVMSS